MAMALVPAVLTLNVSPCSFSVAVDSPDEAVVGTVRTSSGRVQSRLPSRRWSAVRLQAPMRT